MKRLQSSSLCLLAMLCCLSCQSNKTKTEDRETKPDSIQTMEKKVETLEIKKVNISEITGDYNGYKSQYIVKCDFPIGNSPLVKTIQNWINKHANPWNDALYYGDMNNTTAFFNHYVRICKKKNGTELIKQEVMQNDEDENENKSEPAWQRMFKFKKEFENENLVSYSAFWYAYDVGNATSYANMTDCTFRKSDGRQLKWDMFISKKDIFIILEKALKKKFGDAANLYEESVPMPEAPLFLKDGVRFDYGDYTIGSPHYFEEHGEAPSITLPYRNIMNVLTEEAKEMLGL